jgi:hypothetical protein
MLKKFLNYYISNMQTLKIKKVFHKYSAKMKILFLLLINIF